MIVYKIHIKNYLIFESHNFKYFIAKTGIDFFKFYCKVEIRKGGREA